MLALLIKNDMEKQYRYAWKNNELRKTLHNRMCRVLVWGKMSVLLEFLDNGEKVVSSRNAIRLN